MSETKTYSGGCHCGKVRYEVTTEIKQVMACNCSICAKRGHLLTFVPADQFRLVAGEDGMTDYLFNRRAIHHLFCSTCGIESFARGNMPDGSPMCAVNVRCLDGLDFASLPVKHFDGRSV